MSTSSTRRFFKDLQECGLLGPEQIAVVRRQSERNVSPSQVIRPLVADGTMTKWQARKLLQGSPRLFHGKGNKYKLLKKIGRGGMGVVYKAEHVSIGRIVALKVMSADLMKSSRNVSRFLREIQITATLDHPNIIRAYDADHEGGTYFLVMEYLRGRNVREWLGTSRKRVSCATACDLIMQAATGLQHVHERDLVHRDIKPSNLFLTVGTDGQLVVKLLDLGLSRLTSESKADGGITRAGHALGTLWYMAPEQIRASRDADIRADIYALGCTLFELLTRCIPFSGTDPLKAAMAKLKEDAPRVSSLRPEVPTELDDIVARMLERERRRRFATPGEVAAALAEVKEILLRQKADLATPAKTGKPKSDDSMLSDVSFLPLDASYESLSSQDTLGVPGSLTVELARLADQMADQIECAECGTTFPAPTSAAPRVVTELESRAICPKCKSQSAIPPSQRHAELSFGRFAGLSQIDRNAAPATGALAAVHRAFVGNIERITSLGLLPQLLALHSDSDIANVSTQSADSRSAFEGRADDSRAQAISAMQDVPSVDHSLPCKPDRTAQVALEAILSSMIVGTWTAFETLVGDLWEAALNANPRWGLLGGKAMRIRTRSGDVSPDGEQANDGAHPQQASLVEMYDITNGSFDLSGKMGTLHRGRSQFTTLRGIREAYAVAFYPEVENIDSLLADKSLDALMWVRNLLVRKAGIADEEDVGESRHAPAAPRLEIGSPIRLEEEFVSNLIGAVVQNAMSLLKAIDSQMVAAGK